MHNLKFKHKTVCHIVINVWQCKKQQKSYKKELLNYITI